MPRRPHMNPNGTPMNNKVLIKSLTEHKLDSELKEWFKRIPDADFEEICKARGVKIVRK